MTCFVDTTIKYDLFWHLLLLNMSCFRNLFTIKYDLFWHEKICKFWKFTIKYDLFDVCYY